MRIGNRFHSQATKGEDVQTYGKQRILIYVLTFGDCKLENFKTPSLVSGSVSVLQQIPVHVLLIARVLFLLALAQRQHHFFQFVLVFKEMLLVLVIDDRTERLRVPPMADRALVAQRTTMPRNLSVRGQTDRLIFVFRLIAVHSSHSSCLS